MGDEDGPQPTDEHLQQPARDVAAQVGLTGVHAGDAQVVAQLFERYAQRLARLAEQHLSPKLAGRLDGGDVVQSVFRTFSRRSARGEFRIDGSAQIWKLLVRITRPFYLGVHEVTQGQYRAVTGTNPNRTKGPDDLPVEGVSWLDAAAFCNALSEREGLASFYRISGESVAVLGGPGYRLPTEAEWEYACRAGSTAIYSFGDDALDEHAWFRDNSGRQAHVVGQKKPNGWGLYDMHGNVSGWCWDWLDDGYYSRSSLADPSGPPRASNRVHRGGSWSYYRQDLRSAHRVGFTPTGRRSHLGFRVARVPSGR